MPVEHTPFEQIVNVQWASSGLAVIFGPQDIDAPPQPEEPDEQ